MLLSGKKLLDGGLTALLVDGIVAQLAVYNILDTQYRTFASGINAPGRNVQAALKYSF